MAKTTATNAASTPLTHFAKDLMVVHRNFHAYPKGHPLVEKGLERAVRAYEALLHETDGVAVAIARDSVLVDGVETGRAQVSLRQFAQLFFRQGIGLVTLSRGLTVEELRRVLMLLGINREAVARHGGVEAVWEKANVSSISIRAIRYEVFTSGNESSGGESLWERVARGMLYNTFTPDGAAALELDPEILAEMFNEMPEETLDWEQVMDILVREDSFLPVEMSSPVYEKLATFVTNLKPGLREQFLRSAVGALKPDALSPLENIVAAMPEETVLSVLDGVNRDEGRLPPILLSLLQKLAHRRSSDEAGPVLPQDENVAERMKAIFSEDSHEQYIPAEYQRNLNTIISSSSIQPRHELKESLTASLAPHAIEEHFGDVILQLAEQGGGEEDLESLASTIEEMCRYLLHTGEYRQVLNLLRRSAHDNFPGDFREQVRRNMSHPEITDEILNGLVIWGKSRYAAISELIDAIGEPFVGPLLDRLAVEENISIRRFLMEKLTTLGPLAAGAILERLSDTRWYFLRNLLIILRGLDKSLAVHVRPFLKHGNEAVRQEALTTLQHFKDPFVDRRILLDLQGDDPKAQQAALQAAGQSKSPEVLGQLLSMAVTGGLSPAEVDIRCAAVRALGKVGAASFLPHLEKVLHSSSLIRAKSLSRLKTEIIRSLAHYPQASATPILNTILSRSEGTEAAEARKILKEKSSGR